MPDYLTPAFVPAVEHQLRIAVDELYRRARSILGDQCEATPAGVTRFYLGELRMTNADTGPGDLGQRARQAAVEIARDLVTTDFAWWGTPLGRACAWHIGYLHGSDTAVNALRPVPREAVAAIWGISRQGVHKRAQQDDGTLTVARVREVFRERWVAGQIPS